MSLQQQQLVSKWFLNHSVKYTPWQVMFFAYFLSKLDCPDVRPKIVFLPTRWPSMLGCGSLCSRCFFLIAFWLRHIFYDLSLSIYLWKRPSKRNCCMLNQLNLFIVVVVFYVLSAKKLREVHTSSRLDSVSCANICKEVFDPNRTSYWAIIIIITMIVNFAMQSYFWINRLIIRCVPFY